MAIPWRREQARQAKGPDLTKNGTICLSKALLESCCAPLSAESVYAEYFKPFTLVDDETNLSCLKSRPHQEQKIRNSMFHPKNPTEEPAFFSFNSHADINRLSQVIGKNIVIYFTNESWSFFEIFHDFRAFNNNLVSLELNDSEQQQQQDAADDDSVENDVVAGTSTTTNVNDSQLPPPFSVCTSIKWTKMRERNKAEKVGVFYVLSASRKLYQFSECLDNVLDTCCPFFASGFMRMRINHYEDDYGVLLAQVLNMPPPPFHIYSICELTCRLKELWTLWKRKVILVNFCRLNFNQKNSDKIVARRTNPKYSYFFNLGVIAPPPHEENAESTTLNSLHLEEFDVCVCFYGNTFACELKDIYRQEVVAQYKKTSRRDKPKANNFARLPSVSLDEQRKALALELRKKKLKRRLKLPHTADEDAGGPSNSKKQKVRLCSCSTCSADEYNLNMNEKGPERLCTYTLDVADLLHFLGADTAENVQIIDKLSELSVASMDIEAMTVQVHLEPPVQQRGGLFYGTIDQASLEGHFKKVQKPIMIAHTDKITESSMDGNDVIVFTAASDDEEDLYAMMRSYWSHVKHQQQLTKAAKKKIAQPIFELINNYKKAHFDVYKKWCENNLIEPDGKLITRSWYQSLPGQLEKKLMRLVIDYNIFSFYG